MDIAELDVLYRDLPPYQSEHAGVFTVTEKMRVTPPSTELIAYTTESAGEMTVVSLMPPALVTAGLRVITSPTTLTLIGELALSGVVTNPTSIVADVLVSMKTPPHLPVISATPSTVMMVKPVEVLFLGITRSPGVIEAEKKFVIKMVDSFYKSLKQSIALILKGSTTSFSTLKVVLSHNIKSI